MQNMNSGKTALGLDANVGAMLCYVANLIPCCLPLGLVYSIIVLVQDKTNKLPRFHAFQSILLSVVGVAVGILINIFVQIGFNVGGIIALVFGLIGLVISLLGLVILVAIIYAAIKAYKGEIFKLPLIGDMADKWSN